MRRRNRNILAKILLCGCTQHQYYLISSKLYLFPIPVYDSHNCFKSCTIFNNVFKFLFICLFYFLAALGLHCCVKAFSSCNEQGPLSSCSPWISHCGGFSCCRAQALGTWALVFMAPEKAMAPHSRTLAWKSPWTEEPGRLQFMGARRVRHD